jgi:hypothetical protein
MTGWLLATVPHPDPFFERVCRGGSFFQALLGGSLALVPLKLFQAPAFSASNLFTPFLYAALWFANTKLAS